jgi:hypothetical protein
MLLNDAFCNIQAKSTSTACLKLVNIELDPVAANLLELLRAHTSSCINNIDFQSTTHHWIVHFFSILEREFGQAVLAAAALLVHLLPIDSNSNMACSVHIWECKVEKMTMKRNGATEAAAIAHLFLG